MRKKTAFVLTVLMAVIGLCSSITIFKAQKLAFSQKCNNNKCAIQTNLLESNYNEVKAYLSHPREIGFISDENRSYAETYKDYVKARYFMSPYTVKLSTKPELIIGQFIKMPAPNFFQQKGFQIQKKFDSGIIILKNLNITNSN